MSKVDAWGGNAFPLSAWLDDVDPGVDTATLISEKPVSISVKRGAATLSAQTVRLEALGSGRQVQGAGGVTVVADALVLGAKGHPTIPNTDLQAGDRFVVLGVAYEVVLVQHEHADSLQAYAVVRA